MKYRTHQVIRFINGETKAVFNITGIRGGGKFMHLGVQDGRTYLVNENQINWVEVVPDSMGEDVWGSEFGVLHTNNRSKKKDANNR